MASNRPAKKIRRLSTDSEGDDDDLYDGDMHGTNAPAKAAPRSVSGGNGFNEPNRSRRNASLGSIPDASSSATVSRSPANRMRLTVKTSSSKLKEATRSSATGTGKAIININSREQFEGGEILEGKRARNVKRSYVVESEDDDEEEEDEAMEDAEIDAEGEDEEMEDVDAEGEEDEDAEGEEDEDMDAQPPPPIIKVSKAKQAITVKTQAKANLPSVEQKEMQDEDGSDEELSELDSEIAEVEEEEAMQTGNEEDAEGEDEEIEIEEADDDELDSDDELGGGSRASTPDLNKLTKRQRARLEEGGSGHLLALPDEVQVKKHLTAEEHAMRRAEMARRRKNLSEKRNEEEKMETINKLLKKQAPKTNARRNLLNNVAGDATPSEDGGPNPMFVRWISDKNGTRIAVPEEWLNSPAGSLFTKSVKPSGGMGGKLIEEVS